MGKLNGIVCRMRGGAGALACRLSPAQAGRDSKAKLLPLAARPLALLGRSPADARFAARALERGAFRSVYVGEGLNGARAALEVARNEDRRGSLRLSEREHDAGHKLVADLEAAFAPVTALAAGLTTASRLAEAHAAVAEALARDAAGTSTALWQGDRGLRVARLRAISRCQSTPLLFIWLNTLISSAVASPLKSSVA